MRSRILVLVSTLCLVARAGTALGIEPFDFGAQWWPQIATSHLVALLLFIGLAVILYVAAKKQME